MSIFTPEAIAFALNAGHDDPRIDRRRKECKQQVRAAPCPRRDPPDSDTGRGAQVRKEHRPGAAEAFRRRAARRNRIEVDKAVAAAVVLDEPTPHLTATTDHGQQVHFTDPEDSHSRTPAEWWRCIAGGKYE